MSKNLESHTKTSDAKLGLIESLLEEGNFKQAQAEIRQLQNQKRMDDFSAEAGDFYYLDAFTLDKQGRPRQALTKAKKAYEILRNTEKNRRLAQVQQLMGRIYVKLGQLKNAELQFIDTASTYRRIKDQKGIAETLNELARLCFIRSKFGRAIEHLNDALEICCRINDHKTAARLYGNLGTILMLKDQWKEAKKNLLLSLQANLTLHDQFNLCKSLLSLGNLFCLLRKFQHAEDYLKRALDLITENNYFRELAIYHEYQGNLEFARGELDSAQSHFQEAVHIGEQIGSKSTIVSQAYRLLAELQTEKGDFKEALLSCHRALAASKDIGEKLEEALSYRALARIYGRDGRPPVEVKEKFILAIRLLEEMGVKFELAMTYMDMGKYVNFDFWERLKFLGRAEDLACQLDTPYYLAKVHSSFAQLFLQYEKRAETQDFLNKARRVFEQLNEKKDLRSLTSLENEIKISKPSISVDHPPRLSFPDIITQDKTTLKILQNIHQIKDLDITILLEGETGTGKDLLAKMIHFNSNRKGKNFVVVNCVALPESLFESELFGHKKGAFTGAVSDKKGLLDEADGGTVYLDEIADVPTSIQVKLLRAIEEKEIVPIGEVKPRRVDFRIIVATNKNLDQLVKEGKFRNDLFYRLSGMRFRLPPLRERREDIPLLVEHFLRKFSVNGVGQDLPPPPPQFSSELPTLDPKIMKLFLDYNWPGNIRELENEVKRLFISSRGQKEIPFSLLAESLDKFNNTKDSQHTSLLSQLAEYEREQIEKALAKAGGVKTKAARLLNIDEALLRYKIKKYNITFP